MAGGEAAEVPVNESSSNASVDRLGCLLCLSEAALEHGLPATLQLDATIRRDLEASLPWLRACRQLLVVTPASLEEHPRIVNLAGDDEVLGSLRRLHHAFGEALREELMSRELDLLDP